MAISLALSACTAFHNPEPYLPPRSGVVPGDTITVNGHQNVYAIAQEHGVSMRDIIVLNGLHAPFALKPGQSLILPFKHGDATAGLTTLPADAMTPAPLGAVQTAPLSSSVQAEDLPPISQPPPPPANDDGKKALAAPLAVAPVDALNAPSAPAPKPVPTTMTALAKAAVASAPPSSSAAATPSMIWPVQGPLLSGYGPKGAGVNNDGVNIGAPKGAPVVAADNGIVVYAGDEMKGFGNLVLIRHEGGWVTAYAHLDRVLVAKDAVVAKGDMIGTVGKSGNVGSPQLHFETRHDGKAVDPNGVIKS